VREIRTLRAMWRALETGPSIRFTRQRSTLPGYGVWFQAREAAVGHSDQKCVPNR